MVLPQVCFIYVLLLQSFPVGRSQFLTDPNLDQFLRFLCKDFKIELKKNKKCKEIPSIVLPQVCFIYVLLLQSFSVGRSQFLTDPNLDQGPPGSFDDD